MTWQAIPVASKLYAMKKKMAMLGLIILISGHVGMAEETTPGLRTVVASFYPIRLALLNIIGNVEGVRVVSLAESGAGCLHDYQLTTHDMATLSKAEVLVLNGAGLESFRDKIVRSRPGLKLIDASAGIDLLVSGGVTNAHVWVSPSRYIRQVRNIAEGISQWDPVHSDVYRANAAVYIARLTALKTEMDEHLKQIKNREIITFHEAFPYFADEFNFKVIGVIEREPGSSPSAAEMASLVKLVTASKVKRLFVEPQYPAKVATAIARETGASIYTLDPVVSGPDSADAYIRIMERNLAELERALL